MKTQQKRIKFSKGEINPLLSERTDLDLLDNSASYIKNYTPTIYGGIKTRLGTKKITKINFSNEVNNINEIKFPFTSESVINSEVLSLEYNKYIDYINIKNIKFLFEEAEIKINWKSEEEFKVIDTVEVVSGGCGYNDVNINIKAEQVLEECELGIETDGIGKIININVVNGGKYSLDAEVENITKNEENKAIFTINNSEFEVSEENKDVNIIIESNIDYLYLISNKEVKAPLYIEYIKAYCYNEEAKNTRLIPFIYNETEKYLLLVSNKEVSILYNDKHIFTLPLTTELEIDNLSILKYTQQGNSLILTENTRQPKEFRKNEDGSFTIKLFELSNIPYHNFDKTNEITVNNVRLTPSQEEGTCFLTANVNYFTKDFEGQIIDGNGGRFRITKYETGTKVFGYTIIPFYTTDGFTNFKYISGYEPVWSKIRGYPNCCLYYQQRLWFGGSKYIPQGIWASRVGQYNDFNNIGNYDNDAIDVELSSKYSGEIVNLYSNRGLQIFTTSGEFVASEGNLTPSEIFITQTSSVGSSKKINVFDLAGITIFVDKNGLNLNSFVYNYNQNSYGVQTLTLLNNTIIDNPQSIAIDYNSSFEDGNYIYIVNENGTMAVANILLEQNINSFTRFETRDGKILDCINFDNDVYLLTERNNNIFIEKIGKYKTDWTEEKDAVNGIIQGLEDYKQVRVYDNNNDYGVYDVVDGKVEINKTISNNKVYVGLDIDCKLISNDISINNFTNNIKTRLTKVVLTATKDTKEIIFNGKKYNSKVEYDDAVFNMYGVSSYEVRNRFVIESVFNDIEIKSLVLGVNYGS